ncbi:hypothetical protein [Arthrobacter sp. M4]|uniref:COG4315 family predicted lipoprotein n=1 Tax=Arthrobacter sp. M4 TaxID=218160 RepID=UPI001CDC8E1E|nr:hypothetical protein [Arthrobacter sp. M4]MCA4134699.1 hypothetical protein [Arthrobacter sp. M4]
MKNSIRTGLALLGLGVLLSACAGGAGTQPATTAPATNTATSSPSATSSATPAAAVELKTASSSAGKIVVDGKGMTVYFFTKDTKGSGKSACSGSCVATWPAVTTTADTPNVDGVTGTVGTITTSDGKKQVTLNGLPLYHYAQDKAAGDVKGQGVNNAWYVVSPSGDMINTSSAPPTMGY